MRRKRLLDSDIIYHTFVMLSPDFDKIRFLKKMFETLVSLFYVDMIDCQGCHQQCYKDRHESEDVQCSIKETRWVSDDRLLQPSHKTKSLRIRSTGASHGVDPQRRRAIYYWCKT